MVFNTRRVEHKHYKSWFIKVKMHLYIFVRMHRCIDVYTMYVHITKYLTLAEYNSVKRNMGK